MSHFPQQPQKSSIINQERKSSNFLLTWLSSVLSAIAWYFRGASYGGRFFGLSIFFLLLGIWFFFYSIVYWNLYTIGLGCFFIFLGIAVRFVIQFFSGR